MSIILPGVRAALLGDASLRSIPGLVCWVDALRTIGLSDTDAIGTWPDLSGKSNDFAQGTGGNKPLYRTGLANGTYPVVRFDGVDDYMQTGAIPALNTASFTVLAVLSNPSSGSSGRVVSLGWTSGFGAGSADAAGVLRASATTYSAYHRDSAGAFNGVNVNPTVASGEVTVLTLVSDGNAGVKPLIYKNGVLQTGGAAGAVGGVGSGHLRVSIGRASGGGSPCQVDLCAVAVFSVALPGSLRARAERLVAAPYGVGVS